MKKYILLTLIFPLIAACTYKEPEVFDEKPAGRTTETLDAYKKDLEYDGYWLLSYYPQVNRSIASYPRADRGLGGYNIFLKLKSGKVWASSEVETTNDEVASFFTYQVTEGPTLSFDTYNKVLHHFRRTSGQFPNARGGDIEFVIQKKEGDTFTVMGRSSNVEMSLEKFSGNRETYLNKVRENVALLRGKGLTPITLGGTSVSLMLFPSYRQIVFSYGSEIKQQAFRVTDRGIVFFEPITINGVTLTQLNFNDDNTALKTPDGAISTTLVACPIEITRTAKTIDFGGSGVSTAFTNTFNNTNAWTQWEYSWYDMSWDKVLKVQILSGNDDQDATGFYKYVTSSDNTYGAATYYEADFVAVGEHSDQVRILLKDPADNEAYRSGARKNYIQFFSYLVNILYKELETQSPYQVEDMGTYYKLTSVNNSEYWLHLNK